MTIIKVINKLRKSSILKILYYIFYFILLTTVVQFVLLVSTLIVAALFNPDINRMTEYAICIFWVISMIIAFLFLLLRNRSFAWVKKIPYYMQLKAIMIVPKIAMNILLFIVYFLFIRQLLKDVTSSILGTFNMNYIAEWLAYENYTYTWIALGAVFLLVYYLRDKLFFRTTKK